MPSKKNPVDLTVRALRGAAKREAGPVARTGRAARSLAAKPSRPLALPAPPKVLALPAPKPKSLAAKPRGGQFFPDAPLVARDAQAAGYKVRDRGAHAPRGAQFQVVRPSGEGAGMFGGTSAEARRLAEDYYQKFSGVYNKSPEAAAREARENALLVDWVPEGEAPAGPGPNEQLGNWLEKALAKYYKTDFGTEADPLRDLAARGLHYDPDMTPERWLEEANDSLMEDPIGYYTVPRHADEIAAENAPITSGGMQGDEEALAQEIAPGLSYFGSADPIGQGALMQAAPWLRKQPVTDMLYGIKEPLDLGHFTDEIQNAMSGQLPPDLAVRPEMLERMSFAQAAERVGRINQFRVKQMEAQRAAQMNSPAIQMFKEYPDDPSGMRWVELRMPSAPSELPPEYAVRPYSGQMAVFDPEDNIVGMGPSEAEARADALRFAARDLQTDPLWQALKAEGDTMGHCVGGYCDDVASGRSRIFSLRDAKGMPHVTIETSPRSMVFSDLVAHLGGDEAAAEDYLTRGFQAREAGTGDKSPLAYALEMAQVPQGQDIKQIKGKQNRKPNPEYLPFVQDFVKSGQWGDVGDLRNTGLVQLPDRRFITRENYQSVIDGSGLDDAYKSYDFNAHGFPDARGLDADAWEQFGQYFEGFKRGGLAVKKCGCKQCGGFAVRKAA